MTTGTIVILVWLGLTFAISLSKHGEPKPDPNYNAGVSFVGVTIFVLLLWWAGNFG